MEGWLPARDPVLDRVDWRVVFDVDCGELIAGHRFIARGLSREEPRQVVVIDGPDTFHIQAVQTAALHYDLLPAFSPQELAAGHSVMPLAMAWSTDAPEADPHDGADVDVLRIDAHGRGRGGRRGPWPLPAQAVTATVTMSTRVLGALEDVAAPSGRLSIDMLSGTARWQSPAR